MIAVLDGTFEKVNFNNKYSILLYDNKEQEHYPSHWHTPIEIIMPIDEGYTVTVNSANKKFQLKEYDILFVPAGELHEIISPSKGNRMILQFDPFLLQSLHGFSENMAFVGQLKLVTVNNAPVLHSKVKTLLLEIRNEYLSKDTLNIAFIYAKLIEIYVFLIRNSRNTDVFLDVTVRKQREYMEKLNSVLDYINKHYMEDLDLDTVADIAGFSKFHFSRLFRQLTNQSFYDYLNHKRVKAAESLLLNPKLSITDVALQSGFGSISTFNRVFKNMKGNTPSEFKSLYYSNNFKVSDLAT